MSALTPHIRVLRAEAGQLIERAQEYQALSPSTERTTLVIIFLAMAKAKQDTADLLEAEEAAMAEGIKPKPDDTTYNPKGKR